MMSGATSAASIEGCESPKPSFCNRSLKANSRKTSWPFSMQGSASFAPFAASSCINQRGSSSERMGQKPLTSKPRTSPRAAGPLVAKLFEAAMRASGASASRQASAAARIAVFSARTSASRSRNPREASEPFTAILCELCGASARKRSRLGRRTIDPGTPTTYGGRHMSGSRDPVRDSSRSDRSGPGIQVLTHRAAPPWRM